MSLGFSGSRPFLQLLLVHYLGIFNDRLDSRSCCCLRFGLEWSETMWDISLSNCDSENRYEKKKSIQTMHCFDLPSCGWWGNYLNPYGNVYFAVPHIAGFQGSPLHFPYVRGVVYHFGCSVLFGAVRNGDLFIRAAAVPVLNVCCYIFRLSTVTKALISAIIVVLFFLSI